MKKFILFSLLVVLVSYTEKAYAIDRVLISAVPSDVYMKIYF